MMLKGLATSDRKHQPLLPSSGCSTCQNLLHWWYH